MTTYSAIAKLGRVAPGQPGVIFRPRTMDAGVTPIVACHGAGASWNMWLDSYWPRLNTMLVTAAQAGIPAIGEHLGGDLFGNPTQTALVDESLTVLAAETACADDKAHLVGLSMGGATALEYAVNHPDKVATLTLMLPLTSLVNAHATNPPTGTEANAGAGSFVQVISTAWGTAYRTVTDGVTNSTTTLTSATANFQPGDVGKLVVSKAANGIPAGTTIASRQSSTSVTLSAPATTSGTGRIIGIAEQLPEGADILAQADLLADIPARFYYAPDDTYIDPDDVTALATAMGATATATAGGGHTDAGALPVGFDFGAWVQWLETHG